MFSLATGRPIKTVITDTIAYHQKNVIRDTEQLMSVLPEMNVDLTTYNESDVRSLIAQYPKTL